MGMHADCDHGMIMATSMAQLHMQGMALLHLKVLDSKSGLRVPELFKHYGATTSLTTC